MIHERDNLMWFMDTTINIIASMIYPRWKRPFIWLYYYALAMFHIFRLAWAYSEEERETNEP